MRKIRVIIPAVVVALVAVVALAGHNITKAEMNPSTVIVKGVRVGAVDVSNMTVAEATDQVNAFVAQLNQSSFNLKSVNGSVTVTPAEMGLTCDVETAMQEAAAVGQSGSLIRRFKEREELKTQEKVIDLKLKVDNQTTARLLYSNKETLNDEAVDMGLTRENGEFVITEGHDGNEVDYVESVPVINEAINAWTQGQSPEVTLVSKTIACKGSAGELEKVKDVLGSFSTYYGMGNTGREVNVRNGCSLVNGHVIYPGDEFSVNEALSPYTFENGYQEAGSYENGKVVNTLGGGICQVSSTLYNAVIRAELEVTARFAHSMIVTYVEPSDDAAIAGDYKDLRFINNTDAPIYIEGSCGGGYISFTVYGHETRPSDRSIAFVSETLSTDVPPTNFVFSADFPLGYYNKDISAHIGYTARLWKVVTEGGVEKSRDIFNNSKYSASSGTTTIGVAGATEADVAAIQAAIAQSFELKDDAVVEQTVAALAAPAPPAENPEEPKDEDGKKDEDSKKDDDKKDDDQKQDEKPADDGQNEE